MTVTLSMDGRLLAACGAARSWLPTPTGQAFGECGGALLRALGLDFADVQAAIARAAAARQSEPIGVGASISPVMLGGEVAAMVLTAIPPGQQPPGQGESATLERLWSHFESLAFQTHEAFWVWELDPDRCVYLGPRLECLFGLPRDVLLEHPDAWLTVMHPEDRAQWFQARETLGEGLVDLEFRVLPPGGSTRWLWTRMVAESTPAGRMAYGLTRDISVRKGLEEAQRLGEERLLLAVEGLGAGVWDWRADGGTAYYSPSFLSMLGLPPEESRPPRALLEALLSHDEFSRAWDQVRGAILRGEDFLVEMRISIVGLGLRWFRARGRTRLNPDGGPARASGSLLDVTEDKRALRVLEQSERLYRQLFEQNPQCMWIYDQESLRIVAVNERAVRHYGYSRSEFLSMRVMDLHAPELHMRVEQAARKPRDTVWRAGVWPQTTRDGRILQVDITTHDTLFEGRPARMVLAEDVTARMQAEQALKRSEERLSEAQRMARLGWWERDLKTNRLQWSENLCLVFGIPPEAFTERIEQFLDLVHAEDREPLRARIQAAVSSGTSFENTYRISVAGKTRLIHEHGQVARNQFGEPERVFGSAQDITPLWEAEQAVRESESRLRRALTDAPIPAALLAEDGEFVLVNRVWRDLSGYGPEDFGDLDGWARLAYGDGAEQVVSQVLARFGSVIDMHEGEYHLRAQDGRTLVWDFHSSDAGRLPDGRQILVVMAMDVTERQQAMARLADSERRFRIVAQSTNDAVWELDIHTGYIWWSDSFFDTFGFERVEGTEHVDFWSGHIHPEDRDRVVASLRDAMENGAPSWGEEYRFVKGNGEEALVINRGFTLYDADGRPTTILGGMADMTVQRQAEAQIRRLNTELEERVRARTAELEAANKELEAFSYSVSHDLRAPLRAIDGFSRILLEETEDLDLAEEPRRHVAVIRASTQQMGQLIDDLLAFSRLSRQALEAETVDMERLVGACARQLMDDMGDRAVQIAMDPLPPCLGDTRLLRQVWTNLLANAFKYTRDRGEARIAIGAHADGDVPGSIVYHVKDNGVGFDMAYAGKLFGVFQRLHRAEEYEGTGVGLAIVQRIVSRHGGRVWAEAAVGEGATFLFSLPAAQGGDPE